MSATAPERVTVVDCLDWATAALATRAETQLDPLRQPVAILDKQRISAVNTVARHLGVIEGLRRREAQRRAPDLVVLSADIDQENSAFLAVLVALDQIAARVVVTSPGWCSFATRGPSRYFGGEVAVGERVITTVQEVLDSEFGGASWVRLGTADSLFAARCAARRAQPGEHLRVAPGATTGFLAHLRLATALPGAIDSDLLGILARLGIETLGDFAALSRGDVTARFGPAGSTLHALAQGETIEPARVRELPVDLSVGLDIEPPLSRVDQAAFVAKGLAEEFCAGLSSRGSSCDQVAIELETVNGERLRRLWRGEGALGQTEIAQRLRWQVDGWLQGPRRQRPTGGLSRIVLVPDQVIAATGRQLGLWGEESERAVAANRAITRLRASRPDVAIWVLEASHGRSLDELVRRVPIDAIDLLERDRRLVQHHLGVQSSPPGLASGQRASGLGSAQSGLYPGSIPAPYPALVLDEPLSVDVHDAAGQAVTVRARGQLDAVPVRFRGAVVGNEAVAIEAWAGPWLLDERWWDAERHRRAARFQFVLDAGIAVLVETRQGGWWLVGVYR